MLDKNRCSSQVHCSESMDVSEADDNQQNDFENKVPVIHYCQKTDSEGNLENVSLKNSELTTMTERNGRPSEIRMIIRRYNDGTGTPTCLWNNCNTEFSSVQELVCHVYEVHEIDALPKNSQCQWNGCNASFDAKFRLRVHLRHHTNERPEKCDFPGCDKAYKISSRLTTHRRTHNGIKPFKCMFTGCEKFFTDSSDRAKHENRTHTSQKQYHCYVGECSKSYTDPSSLRKHVTRHHGIECLRTAPGPIIPFVIRRRFSGPNSQAGQNNLPEVERLNLPQTEHPQDPTHSPAGPTENQPPSVMISPNPAKSFQSSRSAFRVVPQRAPLLSATINASDSLILLSEYSKTVLPYCQSTVSQFFSMPSFITNLSQSAISQPLPLPSNFPVPQLPQIPPSATLTCTILDVLNATQNYVNHSSQP